ncbi:peroxiredoxin-like family protein [Chitinophaga agrisoli]|nr:peroxiredoxin-like family protein [Chitinophaga agrisoli]
MKRLFTFTAGILCVLGAMAQSGLKSGAPAPMFTAVDNAGKSIDMGKLLQSHKAVILFFYRGQWCPYCNKHIQQLQDSLQMLTGKGAYVIGVTPETGENINKTIEKTHASFSIIQDKDYRIMKAYDVNYVMADTMVAKYKAWNVDLEKMNGNMDHVLPVPATYVIDQSGKISFVQFDKDYRNRASVRSLLNELN